MTPDPRTVHILEQLTGLTGDVAKAVETYRRQLVEEGMPEPEAWALAQKLEERLLGPAFDETAETIKDTED